MIPLSWWWFGAVLPAAVAAVTLWVGHKVSRGRGGTAGWPVAVATGTIFGYPATAGIPPFPPVEAQHWLMMVILPATLLVELTWAWPVVPRGLPRALRAAVIAALPPLLLQPFLRYTWSGGTAAVWLVGLIAAVCGTWWAARRLAVRRPGRWTAWQWLIISAGTGLTLMLSGSSVLGQLGLTLTAAVAGSLVAASWIVPRTTPITLRPSVLLVAVAGLLVCGYFYASLTWSNALLIAAAPLAPWVAELPPIRRLPPPAQVAARLAVVALPIVAAVASATISFARDMAVAAPY